MLKGILIKKQLLVMMEIIVQGFETVISNGQNHDKHLKRTWWTNLSSKQILKMHG
jgi:hypothetical protein